MNVLWHFWVIFGAFPKPSKSRNTTKQQIFLTCGNLEKICQNGKIERNHAKVLDQGPTPDLDGGRNGYEKSWIGTQGSHCLHCSSQEWGGQGTHGPLQKQVWKVGIIWFYSNWIKQDKSFWVKAGARQTPKVCGDKSPEIDPKMPKIWFLLHFQFSKAVGAIAPIAPTGPLSENLLSLWLEHM